MIWAPSVNNLWIQKCEFFKVWKDVGRLFFFFLVNNSSVRLKTENSVGKRYKHGGIPLVKVHRPWLTAAVSIKRVADPKKLTFRHQGLTMSKSCEHAVFDWLTVHQSRLHNTQFTPDNAITCFSWGNVVGRERQETLSSIYRELTFSLLI